MSYGGPTRRELEQLARYDLGAAAGGAAVRARAAELLIDAELRRDWLAAEVAPSLGVRGARAAFARIVHGEPVKPPSTAMTGGRGRRRDRPGARTR